MKYLLSNHRLESLIKHRNSLMILCGFLVALNLIQALTLFFKDERVVIVPPDTRQGFWVEGNKVSDTYLEEMSIFLANLALTISSGNAAFQHEVLLRYAIPEAYSPLKAQLLAEANRLSKDNIATVFRPHQAKVDRHRNRVVLSGDLMTYVGDKRIKQVRETYELIFQIDRGHLQLKSFNYMGEHPYD